MPEIPREFACPACLGKAEVVCPACGFPADCALCAGTGLDPVVVDVEAWAAAVARFDAARGSSWDWVKDGRIVGRARPDGATLLYRDFRLAPDPESAP